MKSFTLEKIKSFEKTGEIEIRPITIFLGQNSSGKSSLVRFPAVVSQTFNENVASPLILFGKLIDYGNFNDVVYKHDGENIGFSIKFDAKTLFKMKNFGSAFSYYRRDKEAFDNVFSCIKMIEIIINIQYENKKIYVKEFKLCIDKENVLEISNINKNEYRLTMPRVIRKGGISKINKIFQIETELFFDKFIPVIDKVFDEYYCSLIVESFKKTNLKDDEIIKTIFIKNEEESENIRMFFNNDYTLQKLSSNIDIGVSERELLNSVIQSIKTYSFITNLIGIMLNRNAEETAYIGPFRKNPERIYRDNENTFNDVGTMGENTSFLLRKAQMSNNDMLEKISKWFLEAMDCQINVDEVPNNNLFKVQVSSKNNNDKKKWDNIIDVGFGISQILPIVTQLYYKNNSNDEMRRIQSRIRKKKNFIFEQPELHLHPAAQANLANLFVDKVIEEKKDISILIETHSEHMIRKLQVLVADKENEFTNNDIAIYYIDKNKNGESIVKRMELNEKGQFIDELPSGFFDKSYQLSKELLFAGKGVQ